jgi:hypothetical protein
MNYNFFPLFGSFGYLYSKASFRLEKVNNDTHALGVEHLRHVLLRHKQLTFFVTQSVLRIFGSEISLEEVEGRSPQETRI